MRFRIFNIIQQLKYLEEEDLKEKLNKYKTIKNWAYIIHNQDKNEDGTLKEEHFHIVIQTKTPLSIKQIAEWIGIPDNMVEIPKGKGAFGDCIKYFTHESNKEQKKGKHLYERNLIVSNLTNDEIEQIFENGYISKNKITDQWILDVSRGIKKPDDIRREVFGDNTKHLLYLKNIEKLEKARINHINSLPIPKKRLNYYLYGEAGGGKGLMSRAIARSLYPEKNDEDIFFEVGDGAALFQRYNGQPVIIWNDFRAAELITKLGGRGNVFDIFDTAPTTKSQNIKYDSVILKNEINIVNSIQNYKEFLNGLTEKYSDKIGNIYEKEDIKQSYRRFPVIIPIRAEDFDLLIDKGYKNGDTKEYGQYEEIKGIQHGLGRLIKKLEDTAYKKVEFVATKKITAIHNDFIKSDKMTEKQEEDFFNSEEFKNIGEQMKIQF